MHDTPRPFGAPLSRGEFSTFSTDANLKSPLERGAERSEAGCVCYPVKQATGPVRTTPAIQTRRGYGFLLIVFLLLMTPTEAFGQVVDQLSDEELEARVADLFGRSCARAGCHAGPVPQMGMDLSPDVFYASTVNEPSQEKPDLMRVHPGRPDLSYLMQKVQGDPDIVGVQMPLVGDKLTEEEVNTIAAWINSIDTVDEERKDAKPNVVYPFAGWKIVNLPTTRTMSRGDHFFLIGHRFVPAVNAGYDAFFGLDGSGIIFLNFGYAPTDKMLVVLARSNAADNVELWSRYQIAQQQRQGGSPLSIGVQASVNWVTEDGICEDGNLCGDVLKFTAQVPLSREVTDGLGVALVPGLLFNPDEENGGDDPLLTLGLGGRWNFWRNVSVVAEWVPIVTGYTETFTEGTFNRFDSWSGGVEIAVGGHVFQIVASNSVGLTTDQYLRGGDLDIRDFFDGDFRIGFNIFRILNF